MAICTTEFFRDSLNAGAWLESAIFGHWYSVLWGIGGRLVGWQHSSYSSSFAVGVDRGVTTSTRPYSDVMMIMMMIMSTHAPHGKKGCEASLAEFLLYVDSHKDIDFRR